MALYQGDMIDRWTPTTKITSLGEALTAEYKIANSNSNARLHDLDATRKIQLGIIDQDQRVMHIYVSQLEIEDVNQYDIIVRPSDKTFWLIVNPPNFKTHVGTYGWKAVASELLSPPEEVRQNYV